SIFMYILLHKCSYLFYHNNSYVYLRVTCGAYSSAGQSSRLITERSQVQILVGPPYFAKASYGVAIRRLKKYALRSFICSTKFVTKKKRSRAINNQNRTVRKP